MTQSIRALWAKFVPLNAEKRQINCPIRQNKENQYEVKNQWRIYQKSPEETWLTNLSAASYLKIDSCWLETNQEKQLFGGEKLVFCQENKEKNISFDYVFCFIHFHEKNQLKRNREDQSSVEPTNQKSPEKLLKLDNSIQEAEITCSICLGILTKCATLSPCGHNFCGSCLVKHLMNSLFCPLCKSKIVSVIKHLAFQNIIEAVVKNSPNLQRPSNEETVTIKKDLYGKIYLIENYVFIGSMLNGKKEGPGTRFSTNGKIFQGFWKNDKKEGEGMFIFKDGSVLNGTWSNNIMQPFVKINLKNGDEYKGETKDFGPHGKGTLKSHDGEVDEGNFKECLQEGFGKYLYNSGDEYEGDWVQGERHGFGIMKFSDGGVYKGEWKKGNREGEGTITLENGNKYEGAWVDDEYKGTGKYIWESGAMYEGNWAHSQRNGNGIMEYPNGDIYKGLWRNGDQHGQGVLLFHNGDKIEGCWVKDALQPMVNIEYSDGSKYKGEIEPESFEKHGKGVLTFQDGSRYEGRWVNDKYDENGKYTSKGDGRVCKEVWKSGSLQQTFMTCADGTQYQAKWGKVKNRGKLNKGRRSK